VEASVSRGVDEKCAKMRAWVAFGANLPSKTGEPAETLSVAVQDLRDMGVTVRRASRVFETPCFPVGAGPSYINFAIEVETALTPEALLALLHQVEARHGRVRKTRWAGRSIDLDLMAMEGEVRPNAKTVQAWMDLPMSAQTTQAPDTLILPHPRIQDRAFMLIPFADLAPDWTHPLIGKTVQEMCDALPDVDKSEIKEQSGLEIPVN
jgi:2-amino-4-hydroxy-6-hydroxymethyldihydropteridine diphosphokinase